MRLVRLTRFYESAGFDRVTYLDTRLPNVVCGRLGGPGEEEGDEDVLLWGAPFGAIRTSRKDVLADDGKLRRTLVGFGVAVAVGETGVRIVTSPAGPLSLYEAKGDGVAVWATHAVAAGYLARGGASLNVEALPELVAYDFVGTTRSSIAGVARTPQASRVELERGGHGVATYWPPDVRWAPVPENSAHEHTEHELLSSLGRRVGQGRRVGLALTAGADSRVLALTLRELGVPTSAFIWGNDGWPEVEGARRVASHLGIPFATGTSWRDDADLRRDFDRDVRVSDGTLILMPSERTWPADADAVLLGAAGEVGRAFYYGKVANPRDPADEKGFVEVLRPDARLSGASDDARGLARAAVADWVDQARTSCQSGWRLLDVLYAEQRVGCWGRSQLPPLEIDVLAGFASQEVLRGLVSLPLSERLTDGFHRRFVAEHEPELALAVQHAPSFAQRLIAKTRRRLGGGRRPPPGHVLRAVWDDRPLTQAWVADEVLRSPLVTDLFGAQWADRVRGDFLAGRRRAAGQATLLAAAVTLADALDELTAAK